MSEKILIAEDQRDLRQLIRNALLVTNPERIIEEADDGQEALEKTRATSYDLLLSDILMPHMTGLELIRTLRRERPGLPVVVISAVGDERCILNCFAEGAWDYLLKPFDVEQLRAVVRRALVISNRFEQRSGDFELTGDASGKLEFCAASEIEYVHRFRRFTEVLLRAALPSRLREDIRLAIEEIGSNAVEWGNRHERERHVRLAYELGNDRITFRIEDEGNGFLPEQVPDPSVDPAAHLERRRREGKRPGGFGIHTIRNVMDEVTFSNKGNVVVMTKYLS